MRRLTSSLVVITGLLAIGSAARAVDITECGQVVPKGQVGVLVGDLDCSDPNAATGPGSSAILLERSATLELAGFSLIGAVGRRTGVWCSPPCRVNGPGSIIGFFKGIHAVGRRLFRLTDVTIDGADTGIVVNRLLARRCTVTGTREWGILGSQLRIFDSEISGNVKHGISGNKLKLRNVIVTGNGAGGVSSSGRKERLLAVDSVITGNGFDCPPDAVFCQDLSASRKRLRRTLVGDTCFNGCPQN